MMASKLDKSLDDIIRPVRKGRPERESPYSRPVSRGDRGRPQTGRFTSVYIGNLAYSVSWQSLKDYMRSAGSVKHVDILSNPDGTSKGCALVEFDDAESADLAIRTLNDIQFEGRPLHIREDREAGRPPTSFGRTSPAVPVDAPGSAIAKKIREHTSPDCQVYVGSCNFFCFFLNFWQFTLLGNLPFSLSWQTLKDQCSQFGDVAYVSSCT